MVPLYKLSFMQKVINSSLYNQCLGAEAYTYVENSVTHKSIVSRFISWCERQDERRFMWMAISFLGSIGMVLPLTLLSIIFFGNNNLALWIIVCAVNVPVLVLNLAAQPSKITLPALFLAWLINLSVILSSIVLFFNA